MVLPLLFGALGGALGSAGALGGLGALGGAAIGSGLGGYAQTGDLETGILTGLGAFAGGSILGPLMGGAGGAASNAATGATAGTTAATTAATAAPGPLGATPGGLGSLMSGPAPASTASILGTPGSSPGLLRGAMDFAKSGVGTGVGVGSMVGASLAPMVGGMDSGKGSKKYSGVAANEMRPIPYGTNTPSAGYVPGTSPEFNYGFQVPSSSDVVSYRDTGVNPFRPSGANPYKMANGGMIRSLRNTFGPIRLAEGGIAELVDMEDDEESGDDEGENAARAAVGGNEKDVVAQAVRAIKGEASNPEVALGAFLAQYGEDALRDLVDKVQSGELDDTVARSEGKMRGPGDGMDDLIPASIEGDQDVLLSDGEFVVPADVVSGLGNGSSDAGARALEDMMNRVREARHGTSKQPPQVPKEAVLPA